MSEQRILVGSTQTLVSYPRLNNGQIVMAQPTSCTVRIGTPAVAMPTATVSATVDTVSTTLSSATAEGYTSLALAGSVAVVAGQRYILTGASGGIPPVLVEAINAGTVSSVVTAEPLPTGMDSGASFKGFAVSYALSAAQTDQPGSGLALWRAVIASVTYEWAQSFRVVRRIPVCPLTATRLTQAYPVIHTLRARTDLSLDELIRTSWEFRVLRALEAKGVQEDDIISTEVLEPLVAIGCLLQLAVQDPTLQPDFVQRIADDYDRTMTSVLSSRHWYEDHQSTNPAPRHEGEQPTPRRGDMRLSR